MSAVNSKANIVTSPGVGSSFAIVSFGRKNLSRFKEAGREGKSFDSNAIDGARWMVDGVIRRELLSGLKGGNDALLVEKGKSREIGWSLGFAVIRIAV